MYASVSEDFKQQILLNCSDHTPPGQMSSLQGQSASESASQWPGHQVTWTVYRCWELTRYKSYYWLIYYV